MPPDWVAVSEDVTTTMVRIKDKMAALSALHARALLPNFDEFSGEDAKVEVLTQEVTRLFKRCEKNLQALSAARPGADAGDVKVRQNVVRAMAAELQKQSVDFRRKQKDYLQKLKQLQDRCASIGSLMSTNTAQHITSTHTHRYPRTADAPSRMRCAPLQRPWR